MKAEDWLLLVDLADVLVIVGIIIALVAASFAWSIWHAVVMAGIAMVGVGLMLAERNERT